MTAAKTKKAYKATFVLDTRGYTEPVDTLVAKLRDFIVAIDGEITQVENHGVRDFARPPERSYANGIYVTFTFNGPLTSAPALREKVRLDRTVNRVVIKKAA